MKKILAMLLVICLCLTGCSWSDGYYSNITPRKAMEKQGQKKSVSASDYAGLRTALEEMIRSGEENGVIYVTDFDQERVEISMEMAVRSVTRSFPIGAYAVSELQYEIGTSGGAPAIAVEISYHRSYMEISQIRTVENMEAAWSVISKTLAAHDTSVVLMVEYYEQTDIAQMVTNYVLENPDLVMEIPNVTVGVYPEDGVDRVLEIQLTYVNSREELRKMQEQVAPLFVAAAMYVTPDAPDGVKYDQLHTFLMERFDYHLETSITPSYSLLRYGVGDSRAFATIYAAMCRRAGLECMVVTGTREGAPWSWNIICDNGRYFHLDLLQGNFREMLDGEMSGYVWDYSAYPSCNIGHPIPEETEPTGEETQPPQGEDPQLTEEETAQADETGK